MFTLEQARALDALAREGTFVAAARALKKSHTSVLYALRGLEAETGLKLLDRSGYRTKLTPAGGRVLEACRALLAAEREAALALAELKSGWEPELRIVFDGIFPPDPIVRAVGALARVAPTRIEAVAEFLSGVEEAFFREDAHLMVSVLPPSRAGLGSVPLPPIGALLVAHASHPLARARRVLSAADLEAHVLLTVRGSDPRLELPTSGLEARSRVRLNDFAAKKAAVLAAAGFGWMPEYLVADELAKGEVVRLRFRGGSEHAFRPRLYHRAGARLGPAAERVVAALRS
jgi:DNA-binding transcriptional LysR family regulator